MTWVKLDDHFDEHPKLQAVGPLGMALWAAGLAYANRNLTDGFIPWAAARSLLSWEFLGPPDEEGRRRAYQVGVSSGMSGEDVTSKFVIDLLVAAGLWEIIDGGYQIHDYGDYQPTKAEIDAKREHISEVRSQAGRAGMASRWGDNKDSKPITTNITTSKQTDNPVPVPVPVPVSDPGPDPVPVDDDAAAPLTRRQALVREYEQLTGGLNNPKANGLIDDLEARPIPVEWVTEARQTIQERRDNGQRINDPWKYMLTMVGERLRESKDPARASPRRNGFGQPPRNEPKGFAGIRDSLKTLGITPEEALHGNIS